MLASFLDLLTGPLVTFNQILTAGISITALSLLLYSLTFNLRDRVAQSFSLIMVCLLIVYEVILSLVRGP